MKHEIQPFLKQHRPNPIHSHKLFSNAYSDHGFIDLFSQRSEEEEIGRKVGFLLGSIGGAYLFTQNKHLKKQGKINKFLYVLGIGQATKMIGGYLGKQIN